MSTLQLAVEKCGNNGYCPPSTDTFIFKPFFTFDVGSVHFIVNRLTTMLFFGVLLIVAFFWAAFRNPKLVPGKMQWAGESAYNFIRDGVAREVIGPEGVRFAPYLTVLFSFVFVMNFYGILPGAQVPVTGRIAYPAVLAVISLVIFNYVGIRRQGARKYFKDNLFPPGVPVGMYIILTPIEALSTFIVRPFTLAVRLFANMFGGHLLLLVFFTGTAYLLTVGNFSIVFSPITFIMSIVLTAFELLVEALQAYIFTILTAVYVSGALAEEH